MCRRRARRALLAPRPESAAAPRPGTWRSRANSLSPIENSALRDPRHHSRKECARMLFGGEPYPRAATAKPKAASRISGLRRPLGSRGSAPLEFCSARPFLERKTLTAAAHER